MQITLELPEDIAQRLKSRWKDLPCAALASLALEAYGSGAYGGSVSQAARFRSAIPGRRLFVKSGERGKVVPSEKMH